MSRTSLRWSGQGGDAMASGGLSCRKRATRANIFVALLLSCLPVVARAADSPIAIAPTTLDAALTALARQSGADIISTEPGLRQIRVKGIAGRMPVRKALDRLLAGTGYRFI